MDEILSSCGDQKLPSAVQEIIRQELLNKLEQQMIEDESKLEERSATESEDERQEYEDDLVCLRSSNSCLRRSRNTRWSPIGSPLIRSPARSPRSNGRSFLTSSAPLHRSPRSSPEFLSPTNSDSLRPSGAMEANPISVSPPKPRRKELYTDLDMDAVNSLECYSPKRSFLAQTVQF
jgi:hypothetical protein